MSGHLSTVLLDRGRCAGLGICESIAPEHFEIDDDGELTLVRATVTVEERTLVEDAVRSCPTAALRLGPGPA